MRWPLKWHHRVGREITCWVLGHRWVSSWRRVRDEEPSGWTKRKSGNPYCEYVSSWRGKCRRCRTRTTNDTYSPFWREVWYMLSNALSTYRIGVTCYTPWPKRKEGRGYGVTPLWVFLVNMLVSAPLFAFEQVWFCSFVWRWKFPPSLGTPLAELSDKITWWVEGKTTYYRWMPPQDPNDRNEIGFWLRKEEADHAEATGAWRTRMWLHTGEYVPPTTTVAMTWTASA